MRSVWTFSFAIAAMLAITDYDEAHAVPVNPQPLSAAAPASDIKLAQEVYRGPRGGEAYRVSYAHATTCFRYTKKKGCRGGRGSPGSRCCQLDGGKGGDIS